MDPMSVGVPRHFAAVPNFGSDRSEADMSRVGATRLTQRMDPPFVARETVDPTGRRPLRREVVG